MITSMNLAYVILYVKDVPRSMAFYESAFGLERRFLHESGGFGEMETGATRLAFCQADFAMGLIPGGFTPNDPAGKPAGIEIALTTSDVPAAYARAVTAGAVAILDPVEKPWGQSVAYVRDPDGILVELCTPMG